MVTSNTRSIFQMANKFLIRSHFPNRFSSHDEWDNKFVQNYTENVNESNMIWQRFNLSRNTDLNSTIPSKFIFVATGMTIQNSPSLLKNLCLP